MFKQVILVRDDLKLSKGKLAVQVAHASVETVLNSSPLIIEKWRKEGMKKVVLKVKNLEELFYYNNLAKSKKLISSIIRDAGKTEIKEGTITCLGIGPNKEEIIDSITRNLKIL